MRRLIVCSWLCMLAAAPVKADGTDPFSWLERARNAARHLDYRGEFILQRGLDISHTRLFHRGSGTLEQERLQSLDGEPRELLRRGDETRSYRPLQRRVVVESITALAQFPRLQRLDRTQFLRNYQIRTFAAQPVAGHDAVAIALDTRDRFHYSYRFWFDRSTALLLRAQTVSEDGDVIEQVGFRHLDIGPVTQAQLNVAASGTQRWAVEHAEVRAVDLSSWRPSWMPDGFVQAASLSRRVAGAGGQTRDVGQMLYSNGLSSVSVFIEPWSAERSLSPLRLGALNMVGKRHGKFWLTIVGDVPMMAVRRVADAIESAQISPK